MHHTLLCVAGACVLVSMPAGGQVAAPAPKSAMHATVSNRTLASAQTMSVQPMPAGPAAAHAKISPQLSSPAHSWVKSEAQAIARRTMSASQMSAMAQQDATKRFAGQGMSAMDIDALVMCVMMDVAHDAQSDLKDQLAALQAANSKKQAQRSAMQTQPQQQAAMRDTLKHHQDQPGDLTDEQQMRLQMLMERMSKAEQVMSNLEKRITDTSSQIIGNLK